MKFKYSENLKAITVSAADIASFARSKRSSQLFCPLNDPLPNNGIPDVQISGKFDFDQCSIIVSDVIDILYPASNDNQIPTIELKRNKKKRQTTEKLSKALEPTVAVIAYITAREQSAEYIRIILSFVDPDKTETKLIWTESKQKLGEIFNALTMRALPFLKICKKRAVSLESLTELPFPFTSIREGQREFINKAYQSIKSGKRLLVSAPTGIGKTMSALYPAVRALGSGNCDKIFCLCAKNITGKAAADAAEQLLNFAPELRCITIIAKERMCLFREEGYSSTRCPPRLYNAFTFRKNDLRSPQRRGSSVAARKRKHLYTGTNTEKSRRILRLSL